MEETKGFKVEITFIDQKIAGLTDPDTLQLQAMINSVQHTLKPKVPGSLLIPSFSPETVMVLQLIENTTQIAASLVQLGMICGKTLTGDYDKWVSMQPNPETSFQGSKIKIRITGSIHSSRKASSKPKPQLSQNKKSKCPYLKKLGLVEQSEREIQQTILRVRTRLGTEYDQIFDKGTKSPPNRSPGRNPARTAGRSPLKVRTEDIAFEQESAWLELPSRFNLQLNQLSSLEPQLLKNVGVALIEKIQVMKAQVEEYEAIQEVLVQFDGPMQDLSESMVQTRNQTQIENKKIDEVTSQVQQETEDIEKEMKEIQQKLEGVERDIQNTRSECENTNSQNLEEKQKILEDVGQKIEKLKEEIASYEKQSEGLHENYEKVLSEFNSNIEQLNQDRAKVLDEKAHALAQLQSVRTQLDHADIQTSQLEGQKASLKATLLVQQNTSSRISDLTDLNQDFTNSIKQAQQKYADYNNQFSTLSTQSTNLNKKIQLDIKDIKAQFSSLSKENQQRISERDSHQAKLDEYQARLEQIQGMLQSGKSIYQDYNQLYKEFSGESEVQQDVLCELTYFADLVFSQAQAGLIANRLSSRLGDMLEQKEFQKASLKRMVDTIKSQIPAYLGRKDDPVDMALSRHLNKRSSSTGVNFVRLQPGKYKFGTREVNLAVEGREVMVKFEGNSLTVEDFLDGFTEIEREKLDKEAENRRSVSPMGSPGKGLSRSGSIRSPTKKVPVPKKKQKI